MILRSLGFRNVIGALVWTDSGGGVAIGLEFLGSTCGGMAAESAVCGLMMWPRVAPSLRTCSSGGIVPPSSSAPIGGFCLTLPTSPLRFDLFPYITIYCSAL